VFLFEGIMLVGAQGNPCERTEMEKEKTERGNGEVETEGGNSEKQKKTERGNGEIETEGGNSEKQK